MRTAAWPGPLAPAGLEHVEHATLDRELHVLHVAEVPLQRPCDPLQLLVGVGQLLLERRDRERRPAAGHDVLALGVEQELAVEHPLAGGGIAAEGHPGARVLAQVAEHHRDHVHRGPHAIGDVVQFPVVDRTPGIPALEHRGDGPPELPHRIVGELAPGLLPNQLLERPDQRLDVLHREVDVALGPAVVPRGLELLLERLLGHVEDHRPVHLDEPAVGVPGEARVVALPRQPLHRDVVEPEVEDRLHHPRHRDRRAGAHRNEQRVLPVAEVLPRGGLQPLEGVLDLHPEALGELVTFEVVEAETAGDGEAGRDGDADVGHLGEARAFAAEDLLHGRGAVAAALSEEVDQRLGVGAAHAGMSGEACRSCTRSSGIGVGYWPEKHAWQKPVWLPAAFSIPSSER